MSEDGVSYHILGVLGQGGFGKVYRARLQTATGFTKEVAVKVLHDESPPNALLKRFRDEARILGLLRDRAIVGVEPPVMLGGRWAVVMDFVDGRSCSAILEDGPFPAGVALEIIEEIARALHNAYNQAGPNGKPLQLLHRDIKPDNIQVTPSGDVCLLDFGIAKANFEEREYKTRQALGGTPGYIAPERLEGVEDPKGDVFSLGVTLHEMITGERPRYAAPTVQFETDGPAQDIEELEVPEALLDDPEIRKILELAGWMRTYDYEQRPAAREVEDRCRRLRKDMDATILREWAEANVPPLTEFEQDERTGTTLTLDSGAEATPIPAPVVAVPTPQESGGSGLAMGALLGGGTVVVMGMALIVVVLVAVIGWLATSQPTDPPVDPAAIDAPAPAPEPDPAPVEPPVQEPEPAPDPTPAPRPDPRPPPVVITLPSPGASPVPTPTPTPDPPTPAPTPEPERPTGLVVVKTIPSGATVKLRGQTLSKSGAGYKLPPGTHVLEVYSTSGESTRIPVQVAAGGQVDICYSFDTNSRCGG